MTAAHARYADLRLCSIDRGFHSLDNRWRLDELLELNALLRNGQTDWEYECQEQFVAVRKQHPTVGLAVNNLE